MNVARGGSVKRSTHPDWVPLVGADGKTNKSGAVLTLGLGGTAPFSSRPHDRYGVAYSQDGVSFPYRDQARPFDLNSENVLEAFYGFALTPFIV